METQIKNKFLLVPILALFLMLMLSVTISLPVQASIPSFSKSNFHNPLKIDNKYFPLNPGTTFVYKGTSEGEPTRDVFTVTDKVKEILGINTRVVHDDAYVKGEHEESTDDWFAQDDEGNVWYFGEHPEDFEKGQFVEAPTWIAGFQDAKPGIVMMAKPQVGMPNVYQGWGPEVGWSDYAQVEQMGQETCVPVDCFTDVLVNAETNLDEQGAFQLKYFARGVGEVRIGWKGNDAGQEELQLVEYKQLSPEELADIHGQALGLENHAYEVSPEAYGETPPME